MRQNFTDIIALDRVERTVSLSCRFCCLRCTSDMGLRELRVVVQYFSGAGNRIPVHRDKKRLTGRHTFSVF